MDAGGIGKARYELVIGIGWGLPVAIGALIFLAVDPVEIGGQQVYGTRQVLIGFCRRHRS